MADDVSWYLTLFSSIPSRLSEFTWESRLKEPIHSQMTHHYLSEPSGKKKKRGKLAYYKFSNTYFFFILAR